MVTQMNKMIAQARHRNELEFADILEGKENIHNIVGVANSTILTWKVLDAAHESIKALNHANR